MYRRAARPSPPLAFALALALVAAACGDPVPASPSPEVVETAESIATTVSFAAAAALTPIPEATPERFLLDARVFGDGPTGVILSHMRLDDQTSWFEFAIRLANTGEFTVLTFDFRGFGQSEGEKQFDRIDADLHAAYEYMREELRLDDVYLVGASMGGTASLIVGAQVPVSGVVSISAPAEFRPLSAMEWVPEIDAPKLFITSEDDVAVARVQQEFWDLAREPKEQYVYEGDAHGTLLFDSEHRDDLESRIIAFLRANTLATRPR